MKLKENIRQYLQINGIESYYTGYYSFSYRILIEARRNIGILHLLPKDKLYNALKSNIEKDISRRDFDEKTGMDKFNVDRRGFKKGIGNIYVPEFSTEFPHAAMYDIDGISALGEKLFDNDGYDKDGYDMEGYDKNGYDRFGYDKDGYNKEGYNLEGIDKKEHRASSNEFMRQYLPKIQEIEGINDEEKRKFIDFLYDLLDNGYEYYDIYGETYFIKFDEKYIKKIIENIDKIIRGEAVFLVEGEAVDYTDLPEKLMTIRDYLYNLHIPRLREFDEEIDFDCVDIKKVPVDENGEIYYIGSTDEVMPTDYYLYFINGRIPEVKEEDNYKEDDYGELIPKYKEVNFERYSIITGESTPNLVQAKKNEQEQIEGKRKYAGQILKQTEEIFGISHKQAEIMLKLAGTISALKVANALREKINRGDIDYSDIEKIVRTMAHNSQKYYNDVLNIPEYSSEDEIDEDTRGNMDVRILGAQTVLYYGQLIDSENEKQITLEDIRHGLDETTLEKVQNERIGTSKGGYKKVETKKNQEGR